MKTGNIYKFLRGAAVVGAVAFFAASCVREPLTGGMSPVPEGKVRVELSTNAGDFTKPVTRAGKADEETVSNAPWVFVFTTNGTTFAESAQAEYNSATGKSYVTLSKTEDNVMLMILANAPDQFWNGTENVDFNKENIDEYLASKTYVEASKMLTVPLDETQTTVPYTSDSEPYPLIPMSYGLAVIGINSSTVINSTNTAGGGALKLHRIVAKVTVENSAAGFTFEGATVVGASRQGYLFPVFRGGRPVTNTDGAASPLTTDYLATTPDEEVTGIAASSSTEAGKGNTFADPIYIYGSEVGQTSVIVKGTYNGTEGYYRLAFKNAEDAKEMAVEYNKWYKFKINSINGVGYGSIDEAIAAPPSNMIAALDVIDLSSHEIVDNGQNYLGVSNSEFIVYDVPANGVADYLRAVAFTGATDYDPEFLNQYADELAVSSDTTKLKIIDWYGETNEISHGDLNVLLTPEFKAGESVNITFTIGNLSKIIKVSRRMSLSYEASATEFAGMYTAGKIDSLNSGIDSWLSISLNENGSGAGSEVTNLEGPGSIYLITKANDALTPRIGKDIYLSRQSESGRVKLYVRQSGDYSWITPALTVTPLNTYTYGGGSQDITINSTATGTYKGVPLTDGMVPWIAEFSTDNGKTWTTIRPDWLTYFPYGDSGGPLKSRAEVAGFPATTTTTNPEDLALQAASIKGLSGSRYNLSTKGGKTAVNTANCYIINSPGYYQLPLVYGNAIKNGATNAGAYNPTTGTNSSTYMKPFVNHAGNGITDPYLYNNTGVVPDNATLVWQDSPGLVANVSLDWSKNNLVFEVPKATIAQGNAIVAVRDASNTILWSWHIWVTPLVKVETGSPAVDQVKNLQNKTYDFMQYNLGWCTGRGATTYGTAPRSIKVRIRQTIENGLIEVFTITQTNGSSVATGDNSPYWQWGRKDPMPPSTGVFGDKEKTLFGTYTYQTAAGTVTQSTAIQKPYVFYTVSSGNWCSSDAYNFWSATNTLDTPNDVSVVKTIYDPSPVGFVMPPSNAWTGFTTTGNNTSITSQFNIVGTFNQGWYFYTDATKAAITFYKAAGFRSLGGGFPASETFDGRYWSAIPYISATGRSLSFVSGYVGPLNYDYRADGFSVRCVSEF